MNLRKAVQLDLAQELLGKEKSRILDKKASEERRKLRELIELHPIKIKLKFNYS